MVPRNTRLPTYRQHQGGADLGNARPVDTDDFRIETAAEPGEGQPAKAGVEERTGMLEWHHCCPRVDSVDETVDELKCRRVTIVAGPMDLKEIGPRAAFFGAAGATC